MDSKAMSKAGMNDSRGSFTQRQEGEKQELMQRQKNYIEQLRERAELLKAEILVYQQDRSIE
jgi:hypothetical protein